MTTKERLIEFIAHLGISQGKFEKECDISNGYVNNIRTSIGQNVLDKILVKYLTLNKIWLLHGEGEMLLNEVKKTEVGTKSIPYYPEINASAGLDFLTDNGNNYNVPISIPNVDATAFINVFGDSMYPKFCSGEIIGIKQIEADYVMYGQAYVVQMKNGEAYLKYIKKGKDDKHWVLASENKQYEPKEFKIDKIDKIFIIKAVITKTTLK
jgi:phage repressor protein C with HTH and peptisase S24 domain